MFCWMKLMFYLFFGIISLVHAAEKPAGEISTDMAEYQGFFNLSSDICPAGEREQTPDIMALSRQFINTDNYSQRVEIFSNLIKEPDRLEFIICLLTGRVSVLFKQQMIYFLDEMKENNQISERDHIIILSNVVKDHFAPESLKSLVFKQFADYISEDDTVDLYIEQILMAQDMPMEFRLFFIKENLIKNICKESIVSASLDAIKNNNLEMRIRDEILTLFFKFCSSNEDFKHRVVSLAVEPDLTWPLQEKALLLFNQNQSNSCFDSDTVVDYLLQLFSQDIGWHIRNAVIWVLADIKKGCDQKIISFFSHFVQQSPEATPIELLDFRQRMIQSILWSLVRLGVSNKNESVVVELKAIAMKYDINVYFRIRVIEALQDLSLYFDSAAVALYEIVRDNKRIARSAFVTYDQSIRDEKDKKVRNSAFGALMELLEKEKPEFLSFLFVHRERLDADQLYRRKAFANQIIPQDIDIYARLALERLIGDLKVEAEYRDFSKTVFNTNE